MFTCHCLVKEFCSRGNFFFSQWVAAGCTEDFKYEQKDIDDYTESLEWLDFLTAEPADSVVFDAGYNLYRSVIVIN